VLLKTKQTLKNAFACLRCVVLRSKAYHCGVVSVVLLVRCYWIHQSVLLLSTVAVFTRFFNTSISLCVADMNSTSSHSKYLVILCLFVVGAVSQGTNSTTPSVTPPTNGAGQSPCGKASDGTYLYLNGCGVCGGSFDCGSLCPVDDFIPLCGGGILDSIDTIVTAARANIVTDSVTKACASYTSYLQCIKTQYPTCYDVVYEGNSPQGSLNCTDSFNLALYTRISCSCCDAGSANTSGTATMATSHLSVPPLAGVASRPGAAAAATLALLVGVMFVLN
jgi:hypothetical protein